eukprot:scaffold37540_cov28-Tisochrysis_lutea.AAC.6
MACTDARTRAIEHYRQSSRQPSSTKTTPTHHTPHKRPRIAPRRQAGARGEAPPKRSRTHRGSRLAGGAQRGGTRVMSHAANPKKTPKGARPPPRPALGPK